eukprot:32962-Prorocentrum_minimum.AAC.5
MLPRLQGPARYPALSDPHVEPSGHNSGLIAIAIGSDQDGRADHHPTLTFKHKRARPLDHTTYQRQKHDSLTRASCERGPYEVLTTVRTRPRDVLPREEEILRSTLAAASPC